MKQNFFGSLALTKLVHMRTSVKTKDGRIVKGTFIPDEANYLTVKDDAVYMPINVFVSGEDDQFGNAGFISQKVPSELWKSATEQEKEKYNKLPILGNFKKNVHHEKQGEVIQDAVIVEDGNDELPF